MGFVGEGLRWGELLERSSPQTPLKNFSKMGIVKKSIYINAFIKVLGILKPFFQQGFKRGSGAESLVTLHR